MRILIIAQPNFNDHAEEPSNADATRVADSRRPKGKLTVLLGNAVADFCKGVYIHQAAQQPFPENNRKDDVHVRDEVE